MGVTCGAETAYPSAASEFTLGFYYGSCCSIFSFYVVFVDHRVSFFCWSLCCLSFDLRLLITFLASSRRAWRCQRGNQNPYI